MKLRPRRYGYVAVMAISLCVAILVRSSNAASIGSSTEEEVPNNSSIVSSAMDDDYYSTEDDYDYKEENSEPSLNITLSPERQQTSQSTSTTTTTTTTTTAANVVNVETNLLDIEDLPAPTPQLCPLACHCTPLGAVNCSGLQLSQLPAELPENLVSLDLSSNRLAEIDLNVLVQFKELRELNLSHNQIHHIQKLNVSELPRFTSINLADNKLAGVMDPETFAGLTGLRKLTLDNNSLALPAEESLFKLPALEELYLRNCSLDGLSTGMFTDLMALKVLDMSDNPPFQTDIDTNTFEPLTSIKKLHLGLMEEEKVLELCTMLTTIDVIHYPDFKISCFEYVNGYTFEQSIVSNTPPPEIEEPYVPPVGEPDNGSNELVHGNTDDEVPAKDPVDGNGIEDKHLVKEAEEINTRGIVPPATTTTTEATVTTESGHIEKQTGAINEDLMNQILLIIILMAFIGLVIGVICRRDYFGIKTKCCRTRRASQTDQVTPAPEEVPLNKITTVSNGNGVTTALNDSNGHEG